jgi:hypothetical protein
LVVLLVVVPTLPDGVGVVPVVLVWLLPVWVPLLSVVC